MASILEVKNLSISFGGEAPVTAVSNLSFTVNKGEVVALVGESGSGKSVTSLSILGLLPSRTNIEGEIIYHEGDKSSNLLNLPLSDLVSIRGRKISMVFQEPMTSLNPVLTCGSQVAEVLKQHFSINAQEAKKRVISWFKKVDLPQPEQIFSKYPHQLSGGQKQRVMIAMAICCEPELMICDEPTTALDVTVQKKILELILGLKDSLNMSVIFISHDLGVVRKIADKIIIMYRGEKMEEATSSNLFTSPSHPYTKALIACRPSLHPKGEPLPLVSDFMSGEGRKTSSKKFTSTTSGDTLVSVENLVIRYGIKTNFWGRVTGFRNAVDGVSFTVQEGETLGLVGESGCGKTTLGRAVLGLLKPHSGRILYRGKDISETSVSALRKEVQLVFQDPYSSLNPRLTIGSAISEPMKGNGKEGRVKKLLDQVGLPGTATKRYPHEFSGGQRQRIVIARALAMDPKFLVCDESVSALDVSVQAQVLNLLNELKQELGLTLLFISHDLSVVRYMSDRMLVMKEGKIVEEGLAERIYSSPTQPYTRELIAAIPDL